MMNTSGSDFVLPSLSPSRPARTVTPAVRITSLTIMSVGDRGHGIGPIVLGNGRDVLEAFQGHLELSYVHPLQQGIGLKNSSNSSVGFEVADIEILA